MVLFRLKLWATLFLRWGKKKKKNTQTTCFYKPIPLEKTVGISGLGNCVARSSQSCDKQGLAIEINVTCLGNRIHLFAERASKDPRISNLQSSRSDYEMLLFKCPPSSLPNLLIQLTTSPASMGLVRKVQA